MVDWSYFDKFEAMTDKYLPRIGEGTTYATQIVTAVTKLVYKWYNDGDVYDNTAYLQGWCNDIATFANWLYKYTDTQDILMRVYDAYDDDDYEEILKDLADALLDEKFLADADKQEVKGSVYKCDEPFRFVLEDEDDEEEYEW